MGKQGTFSYKGKIKDLMLVLKLRIITESSRRHSLRILRTSRDDVFEFSGWHANEPYQFEYSCH
jgi:hypothetical protein